MTYCADPRSKTARSGGVFILFRNSLICTEQPEFHTNCELLWIKLSIRAYYKPKDENMDSLVELRHSPEQVNKTKCNIWLLGGFNMTKLDWPDCTPVLKGDPTCRQVYECFLDIINNFSFCQTLARKIFWTSFWTQITSLLIKLVASQVWVTLTWSLSRVLLNPP